MPASAFAHALVRGTEPGSDEIVARSPERVVMRFTESVEIAFGAIRVYNSAAQPVDEGEAEYLPGDTTAVQVALRPNLPEGTYTVTWHVISADGHPIGEAFVFHVGAPGAQSEGIADQILAGNAGAGSAVGVAFGIVRWINYTGLLLLAGGAIFTVSVWRRTFPPAHQGDALQSAFWRRWHALALVSWGAAFLTTLASLVFQGSVAGRLPLSEAMSLGVIGEVAGTRYGRMAILRAAILIAVAIVWLIWRRPDRHVAATRSVGAAAVASPLSRPLIWVGGALLVTLLATPGLAGHPGTTEPVALNVAMDTLHMVAVATWVGGLGMLLFAALPARRSLDEGAAVSQLAPVVARFSDIAMIAVAAVVITGLFRSWAEVRALRALTEAPYGWVLITKVGVFLPLIALGAINNRWTKPRLQRAAEGGDDSGRPMGLLKRLVGFEVGLVVVVLGLTAVLVNLAPARTEAGVTGPFLTDVSLGDYNLDLIVDPNEAGENIIHLTATTPQGRPAPIKEMRVLFRLPSEGIGPLVGKGTKLAPGHFVVQGRELSIPGEWTLEVVARLNRFDEARTEIQVRVN